MTELFAWFRYQQGSRVYYDTKKWDDCQPLYTHPKEWKSLTKTQINAIFCRNALKADGGQSFARAIEAKLKEKNA